MVAGERLRRVLAKGHVGGAVGDGGGCISFDSFLRKLPFEVLDDCLDCGGVEHCAR